MSKGGDFNFRYASERDRFFQKLVEDYKNTRDELGTVKGSSLRVIFEFEEHSPKERKEQETKYRSSGGQSNAFRGMRTFGNLESLQRFLTSAAQGGSGVSWGRKDLKGAKMKASLRRYVRKGNRIVKEETFESYDITAEQIT